MKLPLLGREETHPPPFSRSWKNELRERKRGSVVDARKGEEEKRDDDEGKGGEGRRERDGRRQNGGRGEEREKKRGARKNRGREMEGERVWKRERKRTTTRIVSRSLVIRLNAAFHGAGPF